MAAEAPCAPGINKLLVGAAEGPVAVAGLQFPFQSLTLSQVCCSSVQSASIADI